MLLIVPRRAYAEIRSSLEQAAGQTNGQFGDTDWTPIRYLNRNFPHATLMGFLRASHVGLVTPVRDVAGLFKLAFIEDPWGTRIELVQDADNAGQVLGEDPTPPRRNRRGSVTYTAYSKKPLTHRVRNTGPTPFNNIVIALLYPEPGRFTAGSRTDAAGYTLAIDNERVRIWRLVLEPGQSAGAITQTAPGIRVVVDGGEIAESGPGPIVRSKTMVQPRVDRPRPVPSPAARTARFSVLIHQDSRRRRGKPLKI
jgi:hypothetical protein